MTFSPLPASGPKQLRAHGMSKFFFQFFLDGQLDRLGQPSQPSQPSNPGPLQSLSLNVSPRHQSPASQLPAALPEPSTHVRKESSRKIRSKRSDHSPSRQRQRRRSRSRTPKRRDDRRARPSVPATPLEPPPDCFFSHSAMMAPSVGPARVHPWCLHHVRPCEPLLQIWLAAICLYRLPILLLRRSQSRLRSVAAQRRIPAWHQHPRQRLTLTLRLDVFGHRHLPVTHLRLQIRKTAAEEAQSRPRLVRS